MNDPDIQRILDFWFVDEPMTQPSLDSRMERWFGSGPEFDELIRRDFGALVEKASDGSLSRWSETIEGRLALIILLDQFRRNIHRGTREAFSRDAMALKLCVEGAMTGAYRDLDPFRQAFFFMPLQHAESLKIQERSLRIYRGLVGAVSETLKATFTTFAEFAELHYDIIRAFGRFPHRNRILGRENTPEEAEYLDGGALRFGQ